MSDNSQANKRIAKNSIFMSIRMVIVLLITFYTTRVVLKVLGVEDYGIYNVVCGFVAMFAFLNTSMSNGIQRFFNFELGRNGAEGANKVFNTAILIQLLLSFVIIILAETIGMWYMYNKMVIASERFTAGIWIFQFSIVSFIFVIMQVPYTAAVMAHESMDFYAYISILDALLKLAAVLILPYIKQDQLILFGFLYMIISVIDFIFYAIYAKRKYEEIKLKFCFNNDLFKSMLSFSGWNIFGSFSGVIRSQGLNLILNFFFGPIVNAARGVAYQINSGVQSFVSNITIPVRPQVIQSYSRGDLNRTMNLMYGISKLSCYFSTLMIIPVSLEINYILHLWLGENVPEHTDSFSIIVLLCSYQGNLNSAVSNVVHATGKMKNYQLWCSIVKMLSIPVAFILLNFGLIPESALFVVLIFDILGHVIALIIFKTLVTFSITDYFKKVIAPILEIIIISLLISYPIHLFLEESFLRLLLTLAACWICTGLSIYYIGLEKHERKMLIQLSKSIKSRIFIK